MDGSTPLNRLPIVVIDLETTGLNVATDRIVQLGGVAMQGGRILNNQTYNRLVNPEIPIDDKITNIHNISNERVKNQPPYRELHLDFHNFLKDKIVVGFNIGFDLAILRNETERLKFKPKSYRCLDVRLLSLILSLPHEILYLESLSEYFSISSKNRHDALGDSIITAKILSKFIPLLREKKILTLGEAERHCQEKMNFLSISYSSDWYYPIPPEKQSLPIQEQEWNRLERIDPFPFSHTVGEFMAKELLTIAEDSTVGESAQMMAYHNTGSILIHSKENPNKIIGIFTERDLLKYFGESLIKKSKNSPTDLKKFPIQKLMKHPIKSVSENTFIYQAIQIMVNEGSRHLLVTRSNGNPIGIISQRDFLKTRLDNFYRSQKEVENVKTTEQLSDLHSEIPVLARRLMKEELSADKISQVISSECNTIVKKGCELALQKMQADGKGDPPCKFSVIVLGSSGRGESLLSFDQDNAIIYEKSNPKYKEWFLSLGRNINEILNTAGIPYCKGGVMAGQEKWCMSLSDWKKKLVEWFTSSNSQSILHADIFVDYIHGFGEERLSYELNKKLISIGQQQKTFLKLMGEEIIANISSPLTLFGNIKTDQGKIDMKRTILFPVVATARLLALKIGYGSSNNTRLRYQAAVKKLKLNDYEIEIIKEIHQLAVSMLLEQQLNHISIGEKPGNQVFLKLFKKRKVEHLKEMLSYLDGLKTTIQDAIVQH